MNPDRNSHRPGWRALWIAAFLLAPFAAQAEETPDYHNVSHFRVEYEDAALGPVTGDAFCKWAPDFTWGTKGRDLFGDGKLYGPGAYGNSAEKQPHCKVRLYNPQTGATSDLVAAGGDIKEPFDSQGHYLADQGVQIALHGKSPSSGRVQAAAGEAVAGARGTAHIVLKVDGRGVSVDVPVMAHAAADDGMVILDFKQKPGGSLIGRWQYETDMRSERDAHGEGRAGTVLPQRDAPVASRTSVTHSGGFRGIERGSETWQPLTPRIYLVHVIEDQAGFDKDRPKFSLYDIRQTSTLNRTLVIFGRDLPVIDGEDFAGIRSQSPDGLAYTVIDDSQSKSLTPDHKKLIAQAIADEVARDPNQGAKLASMQAVVVKVEQRVLREPGPRIFDWDGATWEWTLQYGDNTAALRFARIVRVNDHPTALPGSSEDPRFRGKVPDALRDQTEQVTDLAMPDRVVVEVTVGGPLPLETVPVVLGGPALGSKTIDLVATRLPDRPLVYRTPPVVIAENGTSPVLDGVGTLVSVTKGAKLFAKVDESKTHFLRRGIATANTASPKDVWLQALGRAGTCQGRNFDPKDWPNFAKQTTETVSRWLKYDITYGDHAAMLILRDASVLALRRTLNELSAVAAEHADPKVAEQLIDGWYRSMHEMAVVPGSPLGAVEVDTPNGKVPFAQAYAQAFETSTFHTNTDPNGDIAFRNWRREAAHTALDYYRATLADAIEADRNIDNCDREGLLKLVGAISAASPRTAPGGGRAAGLVTSIAPLLMKTRAPNAVTEPDLIARAYVDSIDQLVERMLTVNDFSSQLNHVIITAASMALGFGGVANLGSVAVELAVGETVTSVGLSLTLPGFVNFSYLAGSHLYESYQSHADVAFAYAHFQTFGIDQYLDAQSKSQPWWKTILKVFGDGIMAFGHPGRGDADLLEEGPLVERGGQVAARLMKDNAPRVGQITVDEQAALALYEAKLEELTAARGIQTRAGEASKALLTRLASADAAAPAAAESLEAAAERKLEQQAIAEVADPVPLGKPPRAELQKDEAAADLVADGEAGEAEEAALRAESPATPPSSPSAPATVETVHDLPFLANQGKALPTGTYLFSNNGRPPITVDITGYVGSGQFANVYKLKGPPLDLPVPLKAALANKPLVIKFLKNGEMDAAASIQASDEELLFAKLAGKTGDRLKGAEGALGTGADAVPHIEFQAFPEDGIVIQEYVEIAQKNRIPPDKEFLKDEYTPQRIAVAKLIKKLIDRNLRWRDPNGPNIYLAEEGDGFVAKILDADYVTRVGDPPLNPNLEEDTDTLFGEYNTAMSKGSLLAHWQRTRGNAPLPFDEKSALAQQMITLEEKGILKFNGTEGIDQPGMLKPSDFNGILDWPGFRPAAEPQPPPPPPPPPPKLLLTDPYGMQRPIMDLDYFRRLPMIPGGPPTPPGVQ